MANIGPLGRPFPPVYDAVDRYSWKDDAEFQSGLSSILSSDVPAEQAEDLKLKAQCFYFERKFDVPIDFEEYKAWREYKANKPTVNGVTTPPKKATEPTTSSFSDIPPAETKSEPPATATESASDASGGPQYPTSFAHVVELISSGKPIPGIKEIPSTVLEGQSSESTKPRRPKPWEKTETPAAESAASPIAT